MSRTLPLHLNHDSILAQILAQEPIFHRPHFAATLDDFDRLMAPDYWEVGASGCIYTRESILAQLRSHPPIDAEAAGWQVLDPSCRQLSETTYLFTYTLHQERRHSRRSTIWQLTPSGWQILYHQGTLLSTAPGPNRETIMSQGDA